MPGQEPPATASTIARAILRTWRTAGEPPEPLRHIAAGDLIILPIQVRGLVTPGPILPLRPMHLLRRTRAAARTVRYWLSAARDRARPHAERAAAALARVPFPPKGEYLKVLPFVPIIVIQSFDVGLDGSLFVAAEHIAVLAFAVGWLVPQMRKEKERRRWAAGHPGDVLIDGDGQDALAAEVRELRGELRRYDARFAELFTVMEQAAEAAGVPVADEAPKLRLVDPA